MGKIIYNGIDCGSGSSVDIEPNPTETATDTLEKLGIDGTVYDFEGTTYTAGTNIQINENVISATDTTYSAFQGTDGTEAGSSGLVPAPAATDTNKYLKSDGTWATVSGGGGSGNVDDVYVNGTSVLDSNHIAQVKSYKELTQAQYDALPYDKLTDNILYCIKDTGIVEGEKFAPIIYSLEEREVGVWIDGKPLYQKTWILTVPNASGIYDYNETVSNLDEVCHTEFSVFGLGERHYTPWYNPATIMFGEQTSTYIEFYFASTDYAGRLIKYTSQYTKTTDNAGSGAWTTSGVPAVHYSTTEQIVGTWIDGKPLYQKTIPCGNISGSTATIPLNIENVKYINLVPQGSYFNSSNSTPLPFPYTLPAPQNVVGGFFDTSSNTVNFEIRIGSGMVGYVNNLTLTVQYTKTTD